MTLGIFRKGENTQQERQETRSKMVWWCEQNVEIGSSDLLPHGSQDPCRGSTIKRTADVVSRQQ